LGRVEEFFWELPQIPPAVSRRGKELGPHNICIETFLPLVEQESGSVVVNRNNGLLGQFMLLRNNGRETVRLLRFKWDQQPRDRIMSVACVIDMLKEREVFPSRESTDLFLSVGMDWLEPCSASSLARSIMKNGDRFGDDSNQLAFKYDPKTGTGYFPTSLSLQGIDFSQRDFAERVWQKSQECLTGLKPVILWESNRHGNDYY